MYSCRALFLQALLKDAAPSGPHGVLALLVSEVLRHSQARQSHLVQAVLYSIVSYNKV